ncbi:unnamed protein product [Pleuronectes platessa]|uniref:Uncharacterized protein n=1 Tax=Pleuronectes platessa TaxID=8262 RepID=A0A9N7TQM9_PLEPL|nr:unnamed protein product [Pleuronectes platessa]
MQPEKALSSESEKESKRETLEKKRDGEMVMVLGMIIYVLCVFIFVWVILCACAFVSVGVAYVCITRMSVSQGWLCVDNPFDRGPRQPENLAQTESIDLGYETGSDWE